MSTETEKAKGSWGTSFIRWSDRWVPNSMVFVFILTIVVAVAALIFTSSPFFVSSEGSTSVIDSWTQGFWRLLTFAMQMSLVMLTGFVVASAPIVNKGLKKIAMLPSSQTSAYFTLVIISVLLNWFHWGFGMMGSIVLGREILAAAKTKGYKCHGNLFIGISYTSCAAAAGIAQVAPLFSTSPGWLKSMAVTDSVKALVPDTIPLNETVLSSPILIQCLILFLVILFLGYALMPRKESNIEEISDELYQDIIASVVTEKKKKATSPAEFFNNSPILNLVVGGAGLIWALKTVIVEGLVGISINNYNFLLLSLGVVLCRDPETFISCVKKAIGNTWGVAIQFPFYAGIFGIIAYTGLNDVVANLFMSISSQRTFPLVTYIYSSILNFFVPSGGSKFVIEVPYLLSVTTKLGSNLNHVITAYTFGDLTTNIIQPFWALPYLAMFKIDFKKILPYTFMVCIACYIINILYIGLVAN